MWFTCVPLLLNSSWLHVDLHTEQQQSVSGRPRTQTRASVPASHRAIIEERERENNNRCLPVEGRNVENVFCLPRSLN